MSAHDGFDNIADSFGREEQTTTHRVERSNPRPIHPKVKKAALRVGAVVAVAAVAGGAVEVYNQHQTAKRIKIAEDQQRVNDTVNADRSMLSTYIDENRSAKQALSLVTNALVLGPGSIIRSTPNAIADQDNGKVKGNEVMTIPKGQESSVTMSFKIENPQTQKFYYGFYPNATSIPTIKIGDPATPSSVIADRLEFVAADQVSVAAKGAKQPALEYPLSGYTSAQAETGAAGAFTAAGQITDPKGTEVAVMQPLEAAGEFAHVFTALSPDSQVN